MLTLDSVRKTFNPGTVNEVRALQGIDLHVEKGSFVIVLGMNGSGKSTLLNTVSGTLSADSGRIRLAGTEITRWPEHKRARLIGRVFQSPFSGTAPEMSIAENFALASRRGLSRGLGRALSPELKETLRERIGSLDMGLETRLDTVIGCLSGGQRQALTLLMATWLKPELLLLDEHTAALDPKSAEQIIALSQEVIRRDGLTTLMVTHSMRQAVTLGDRLIMMHQGKIIHDFSAQEKKNLQIQDLLDRFEAIRQRDLRDDPTGAPFS